MVPDHVGATAAFHTKGFNLMPDNQDITLKIFVLDEKGNFRGGTVDVEFKHLTLSDHGT
jgi:hypothetical protein